VESLALKINPGRFGGKETDMNITIVRGAARPAHTEQTRNLDEIDLFCEPLTDAELEQYASRTTDYPGFCLAIVITLAFFGESLMNATESALHWLAGLL
jgi:hypothetical protein